MVKLCIATTHKLEGEIVENPSRLGEWIGAEEERRTCRLIPRTSLFCCSLYCLVSSWCLWLLCVVLEVLVKTISGRSIWINLPNLTKTRNSAVLGPISGYLSSEDSGHPVSTPKSARGCDHSSGCYNGFWRFYCIVFLLYFFVVPYLRQ